MLNGVECLDSLLAIADQSEVPGLRDYVESHDPRVQPPKPDPYARKDETPDIQIDLDRLNALLSELASLQAERQQEPIFTNAYRDEEIASLLQSATSELSDMLDQVMAETDPDNYKLHSLITAVVTGYIGLDLCESALEWIDRPDLKIPKHQKIGLECDLFQQMLRSRGEMETHQKLRQRYARYCRVGLTVHNHEDWIMLARIADMVDMRDVAHQVMERIHSFVTNKTTDSIADEQRCEVLKDMGYYYVSSFGQNQEKTPDRVNGLNVLNEALQIAENMQDAAVRQDYLIRVARAFVELDFMEEAFTIFFNHRSDRDFVVDFYSDLEYKILEYYDNMDEDEYLKWGKEQRKSWLLINLYHLKQPTRNHRKRIATLAHFCNDLNSFYGTD